MGRRRNKLRNPTGLKGLFFRHECRIFEIAHVGSRTISEDQFLHANVQFILVPPPHFQLVLLHLLRSSDGTGFTYLVADISDQTGAFAHYW